MTRLRPCPYGCGHQATSTTSYAIHLADAHSDMIGVGVGTSGRRSRRTWSCWHCATENPPTTSTCTTCGWQHPHAPTST